MLEGGAPFIVGIIESGSGVDGYQEKRAKGCLIQEWWFSLGHLDSRDAQTPYVHLLVVAMMMIVVRTFLG